MKTFRMIGCAIFAILLCLSACSGGGDDPIEPSPKPEVTKSEINIDSNIINNGLSFSNAKGEQSISFSTNENWTLCVASTRSGATWCTASATSGSKGSASVKFSVTENTDYDDRSVSVTIKSGTASKTFTIVQKGVEALLVTTNKYEVNQKGGTIDIEVKANIEYKMEISETAKDWISDSSGRSLTSYKHSLSIAMNEENEKREGEIYFKSGEKADTVKVYQIGGPIILLSQNEYTVSDAGDTISVDVRSNIEYGVQMPDVEWIIDESSSRGMSSHTLKYIIASNEDYDTRSANIIFYDKNSDLKDTLTISQQGKVFETDYVDLRFEEQNVTTTYNATDGSLTVTYPSDNLPNIKAGNSIVLPAEYDFDIRVIESVSISNNTLRLQTSQGNMCNLFRNINFTLTTDPSVASRSSNGESVYIPTAYGYIDENGRYHEIYNENQDTRAVYVYEKEFLNLNSNYNGDIIYEGKAGKLNWDKCELFSSLNGTLTFDFGEKEISEVRSIGDLKKFTCSLNGNIDLDLLLHYNYNYENAINDDEIFKYNIIPTGVFTFAVGNVPVVLLVYTHLGKQYHCQIEGQIDATTGLKFRNEMSIGLEWIPNDSVTPIKNINPTYEFYPQTVKTQASVNGKVSYYPQIEVGIYKFLGPWFEPRPYLKETVGAGFVASTNGENYIGWKAETYNGMDLRMGLETDFGFWRKDVWISDIYNVVKDQLLFEAPSRITTLSPENNVEVEKGKSVAAEFMVESFSPITNKHYPCPWALVNFESECGELDKPLAVTNLEGKAMVNWTPSPSVGSRSSDLVESTLTAKLVNKEGTSIDEATLIIRTEDDLRAALIKLYKSTNGDNWTHNDNWCSEKDINEWYGVYKYKDKCRLSLANNNLTGYIDQTFPDNVNIDLDCENNLLTFLNVSGCSSLRILDCSNNQLNSLDVSGCANLSELNCLNNQLTSLKASGCTSLSSLSLGKMQLSSLDVSGCSSLATLYCNDNKLTSLNVSGCVSLTYLSCNNNQLTSLDVSGCTSLTRLDCYNNQLSSPLNVSNFISLTDLRCENNLLTTLNASGCTSLTNLNCYNNQLTSLDVSGCSSLAKLYCYDNQLTTLNVSGYTSLKSLDCENNPLTTLNASGCTSLTSTLNLSKMQLTFLDVSGCKLLSDLYCDYNQLTTLNVSGCTNLRNLICHHNQLTSLDVSGFTLLKDLTCSNNQLTSLNVSGCNALVYLFCFNNRINQEIPDWFTQLTTFSYDVKYKYYNENGDKKWEDQGYGWWYPGEPGKGYHGR